jgi:RimJ/RimL family protein N-acetyltransferase
MQAPTLTTERLIIEPMAMKHWETYAEMWADPRMTKFISGEPRSRDVSWTKFSASAGLWPLLGYGYWAFADRESKALLGVGGLSQWERGMPGLDGFVEAGWGFAPQVWGKGYATEAMEAVLAWADCELDEPEIRCIIDIDNVASMRVGEKLGFALLETTEGTTGALGLFSRQRGG